MSLIDVILGQKIIPLTIGLALLLIMLALVLTIVPRIRKHRAKAAQVRAERMATAAAEQEAAELEAVQSRTAAKKQAAEAAKPAVQANAAKQAAPAPAAKPAASILAATPSQPAAQPQSEAAPSAMQDILSSVFSDEDNSERQAALMRGMSDVDMNDLLTLTQQVVVQLHGGKTVTVVSEKELQ